MVSEDARKVLGGHDGNCADLAGRAESGAIHEDDDVCLAEQFRVFRQELLDEDDLIVRVDGI